MSKIFKKYNPVFFFNKKFAGIMTSFAVHNSEPGFVNQIFDKFLKGELNKLFEDFLKSHYPNLVKKLDEHAKKVS